MKLKLLNLLSVCLLLLATLGLSAQIDCDISAGRLSTEGGGRVVNVCLDDPQGLVDINRDGFVGGTSQYFITYSGGLILEIPAGGPPFDLSAYGDRTLAIWSVSYTGTLIDAEVGDNICASSATGCFSLSNAVAIARNSGEDCDRECTAMAGNLSLESGRTDTTICILDGADSAISVNRIGSVSGQNRTFVITTAAGEILNIPGGNGPFDLSGAGVGACNIWYLTYDNGLTGLAVGNTPDDFEGCFSLSNPITVTRVTGDDCEDDNNQGDADFVATLNGVGEVPNPITTTGNGSLTASLRGNTLTVSGSFDDLTSDFDPNVMGGAHLHFGYAGMGGPITILLDATLDGDLRGGTFEAANNTFTLTGEQEAALRNRNLYVNIHTLDHPPGEIRGQLVPAGAEAYHRAYLLGVNEVPAVVSVGIGGVVIERTGNQITLSGGFMNLESPVNTDIGAHIHIGEVGRNGSVIIPLDYQLGADNRSGFFPAGSNTYNLTADQVAALDANGLYVNVHTIDQPAGELRGQITPMSTLSFYADLSGHQARPNPICSEGNGRVQINIDGNQMTVFGSVNDLDGDILLDLRGGAHLHLGYAGQSGPIVFEMTATLDGSGNNAVWRPEDNTFTVTDQQIAAFSDRRYYVNVHTTAEMSGEVRGQTMALAKGYFGSNMMGLNALPSPKVTSGNGFTMYEMRDASLTATGAFNSLVSDYNTSIGSHIHRGSSAESGPVIFGLNVELADDLRSGVYLAEENVFDLSAAQMAILRGAGYYFNLHTVDNPSGEIRGQLLMDDNRFPTAPGQSTLPDGVEVTAFPGGSDPQNTSFAAATDPDGNLVTYKLEVSTTAGLGVEDTIFFNLGTTNSIDTASAILYDTLSALGLPEGVPLPVQYRIFSSDGSVGKMSEFQTARVTLDRNDGGSDCDLDAGTLTLFRDGGTSRTICAGDGVADPFSVIAEGFVAPNYMFVVTDANGNILDITSNPNFDFEGAGGGACQIWGLAYDDTLTGATVGNNVSQLSGCFELSNNVVITRLTGNECDGGDGGGNGGGGNGGGDGCTVDAGTLTIFNDGGTTRTICAGDGVADPFSVIAEGFVAPDYMFVVTDANGNILDITDNANFDFEGAGGGACQVWGLAYDDTLTGATVGNNVSQLGGCFDLSNNVVITRLTGNECDGGDGGGNGGGGNGGGDGCTVDAGTLTIFNDGSTTRTICAGDGVADPFSVIAEGFVAPAYMFVVTDANGNILDITDNANFDFEGAGGGACQVWGLAYDDTLTGATVGNNVSQLGGCFELSNNVTITRLTGNECDGGDGGGNGGGGNGGGDGCTVDAGTLTIFNDGGTTRTICAGDGVADPFSVIAAGFVAPDYMFVVTDANGNILDITDNANFDFEGAGGGACQVWGLAYDDTLTGATVGNNVSQLGGCFDLSNNVTITRLTGNECDGGDGGGNGGGGNGGGDGCTVDAGTLTIFNDGGTTRTICAGDGVADPFSVIAEGFVAPAYMFVVTDANGNILDITDNANFDFEGAGGGACQVWGLAYDDTLTGAAVGNNVSQLGGCFELSNNVIITRLTGDDCDNGGGTGGECVAEGGSLTLLGGGDRITTCADDGLNDNIDVVLTGNQGTLTYIITDGALDILSIPAGPPFNLEGAGQGTCFIWAVSSNGPVTNLAVGSNVADFTGCFDISNQIAVDRNTGDACGGGSDDCNVSGGTLVFDDGEVELAICVDGTDAGIVTVVSTSLNGPNQTFVVTDLNGNIINLTTSSTIDFSDADPGSCLIWALAFEDGLTGAEIGNNAGTDLDGCFSLSNSILIERIIGEDCVDPSCDAVGGQFTIADGGATAITICAGDGDEDSFATNLNGNVGDDIIYVITDANRMVLDLPDVSTFNLESAGEGVCLVYAISSFGAVNGLAIGSSVDEATGCYALSNPITVTRQTGTDCDGGLIADDVIITEVFANGHVELYNQTSDEVDIRNLFLNNGSESINLLATTLSCGEWVLKEGDAAILDVSPYFTDVAGEMSLAMGAAITADALLSYVSWGNLARVYETAAVSAGIWSTGNVVGSLTSALSVQRMVGTETPTYELAVPTPCVFDASTSNTSLSAGDVLKVYPNPFSGNLVVEVEGLRTSDTDLQVLDITGRVVLNQRIAFRQGRIELNTTQFAAGTYVLRLSNAEGASTVRVVKR